MKKRKPRRTDAPGIEPLRRHVVDDGFLRFDRRTGMNTLLRGESTAGLRRVAPRALQVELLSQCNLGCSFCRKPAAAPDRLDRDFLLELLARAGDWGVLEVAFGGGEPLLYPDLVPLLRKLHERTDLGLNITTNGTLMTPRLSRELAEVVGEIRISALPDNGYRRTLKMLAWQEVAVNWLVTPANVGRIEPYVLDFLALGARNVLLLGYKGGDPSLHLSPCRLEVLKRTVLRLQHLPLRLDVCWYPLLPELPHLFPRKDCNAGDEMLVITPDRAVQPCSFHHEKIPFHSFQDLQAIYHDLRRRRPPAGTAGCTRASFPDRTPEPFPRETKVWIWQARSSNNSGDWTIVGRFQTPEQARQAAESLRELARAHEAFLASPEGQRWLEENDYHGSIPSPPLRLFGHQHGFDWLEEGDGLWWEEDGCGAPVLTAGAVGDSVVVYHPYCMGLPERPFKQFFARIGATEFGYWQYDRPAVVVTATGDNPAAMEALKEFLALVDAAEYASEVESPPPWGEECLDPRVRDDEDRTAQLADGRREVHQESGRLRLALSFENIFAGALSLERWLIKMGYRDIEIQVEPILKALAPAGGQKTTPRTGLFGDVRSLPDRLRGAPPEKVIELVFNYYRDMPDALARSLKEIPGELRLRLCRARWEECRRQGQEVSWQALLIIQDLGPIAADWMRTVWRELPSPDWGFALKSLAASLPPDEAFSLAREWAGKAPDRQTGKTRLMAFGHLSNRGTLPLIENWWESAEPETAVTDDWGRLAADSRMDWPTARDWMERGRPLSLIALDTLLHYLPRPHHHQVALPPDFHPPDARTFRFVLTRYRDLDDAPRVDRIVSRLLKDAASLLNHE